MGLFDTMAQGLLGGLGGGLISGGLGAISSIFSNNAQKKENARNREFSEYMYDRQYDNNIKLWNMQNKYDLPSAQKQRLLDAGLNADLMYSGKGISPTPNLQAAVSGSPSTGSLPGYGGVAEAFNQGRLLDAQIRNIDADTEKKKSETEGQGYQNNILKTDSAFREDYMFEMVDKLRADNKLTTNQAEVCKAEYQKFMDEINNLRETRDILISEKQIKKFDLEVYRELKQLEVSIKHNEEAISTFEADHWFEKFEASIENLKASTESIKSSTLIDTFASDIMKPLAEFTKNNPTVALTLEYFKDFLPSITTLISTLLGKSKGGMRSPYEGPNHPTPP